MSAVSAAEKERAEVDAILQAGVFAKAPRLAHFFRYICDRHFEGRAECLKEYSIAVEALGRSADFDPKKDSIVRVEAHRLRKRLEEFYAGPGAGHDVCVVIPNGQYRPQFIVRSAVKPDAPTAHRDADGGTGDISEIVLVQPLQVMPSAVPSRPATSRSYRWVALGAAALAIIPILAFVIRGRASVSAAQAPREEIWQGKPFDTAGADFRMLAGYHGAPYVDRQSHLWQPDTFYRGGTSHPVSADRFIEGQPDAHLIRSLRTGDFTYDIPLRQGTYELHLLFVETEFGRAIREGTGEASRVFSVLINGQKRLVSCDPLADVGAPNRLEVRVLRDVSPADDGKLHIHFLSESGSALLNGLEILPSTPGRIHPIRIVTQAHPVTDADGRVWAADEYVVGGTTVFRENASIDPKDRPLFQGERFGHFTYRIPLAPGQYRLTLHFAEQWFGTPSSPAANAHSRVFDVYANGVALLRNFEVAAEAGGPDRSLTKSFDHLQPNAQGMLVLEFVPVKNYAELNALEVVQSQ